MIYAVGRWLRLFFPMPDESARIDTLAQALQEAFGDAPEVAVVAGSGWDPAVEATLEDVRERDLADLPEWPVPAVDGHRGVLHVGRIAGRRVAVAGGRVHAYEGRPAAELVRGVRALVRWGAPAVLLTNAAGSLDTARPAGTVLAVSDHLNLGLPDPQAGPRGTVVGGRFHALDRLYDPEWRAATVAGAVARGAEVASGIYAGVPGPSYETRAEVRMLQGLGADAVGMSTIPEAIAAHAMGARVAALALLTNLAAGLSDTPPSHQEVLEAAATHREAAVKALEAAVAAAKAV